MIESGGGRMLQADIDELGKLVTVLDDVGREVDKRDVRCESDHLGAAVAGTDVAAACVQLGEFIEGAYWRVTNRLQEISKAVSATTSTIQATDEDFAQAMRKFDVHRLEGA
ncbi:hypothetical protein [Nocardia asteroides]|uniref:Excreted virulence factor EspC (Type VII ESX diderm) n=1 Tax=Nocardia asteroides NBRC 15531 TaxID=1110697 RepID=U5EAI6_NOCAS|nr:hypothetical protein [Nocardia asteroides]TLF69408.1 hypothetical protein FEK33_03695 [Nocardia asteroides NBRC 15531]UGT48906.1 hypothetical protein LT345_31540 [Nocardia asteroides]SFL74401.1 hypothetical protein SAMN05444423_101750 [Nocardia asteroides]VEG31325.1 Uncharacterised protein [Nocardia asteroides]GAD83451.1 hypothetical protein NCAST_20_00160 [Nocardia asteroides NBRC 15531]